MTLDLKAKYESGQSWEDWLAGTGKHAEALQSRFDSQQLTGGDIETLRSVRTEVNVLCLSEAWCGDCVRQVPIMAKCCAQNPNLKLRIIGRDDNLDVMERYLFNGAAVVPVFVFFNEQFIETGCWKARPLECQEIVARGKAAGKLADAKREVEQILNASAGRLSVDEFKHLIDMASESSNG